MKLYTKIYQLSVSIENCQKRGNEVWEKEHQEDLDLLLKKHLPSGNGFNSGTQLLGVSDTTMFFETKYHHMDENGFYDGCTTHKISVKPGFDGITVNVGGKDTNGVIDDIEYAFYEALITEV